MCIAILNRNGILPQQTFTNSWKANPDGGGYAFYDGRRVVIKKDLKDSDRLWKQYAKDRKRYGGDFLIHFRIGTSGLKDLTNCHPFRISETAAFIHNGIITDTVKAGNYSDTYHFNEDILKRLPQRYLNNHGIVQLMAGFIGYSKLVFLIKGRAFIVNESFGNWSDGNWYSNKSYECTIPKATTYGNYQYRAPQRDLWNSWSDKGFGQDTYTEYGYDKEPEQVYCDNCMKEGAAYCRALNADLCRDCKQLFEPEKYGAWLK